MRRKMNASESARPSLATIGSASKKKARDENSSSDLGSSFASLVSYPSVHPPLRSGFCTGSSSDGCITRASVICRKRSSAKASVKYPPTNRCGLVLLIANRARIRCCRRAAKPRTLSKRGSRLSLNDSMPMPIKPENKMVSTTVAFKNITAAKLRMIRIRCQGLLTVCLPIRQAVTAMSATTAELKP